MTLTQFIEQFGPVMEAFDSRKFPMVVLERIHARIDGLNSSQMRELCNEIIDRCEHAPRTSKVVELANIVRARHHKGLYHQSVEEQLDCAFCGDLRTIRAVSTDGTHETLMLCDCTSRKPDQADWPLPVWSRQWAPLYRKEPCPVSWFMPAELPKDKNGEIRLQSTNHNRDYWRHKIRIAEQFWEHEKANS